MKFYFLLFVTAILFNNLIIAENNIDSLTSIANSNRKDTNKVLALNKLSMYYEYNDTAKAWNYNRQALTLGKSLQWIPGLAKTYIISGWLYQDISKYDISLEYMNQSLSMYQLLYKKNPGDLSQLANISGCYNNLGNVYTNKGNYPKALQCYILGLKKVENLLQSNPENKNYLIKVTACYTNLGSVYAYMNDNQNALSYFNKAKDMAVSLKDSNIVARCLINMGIIYKRDTLYDKAIDAYQSAKIIFENQKDLEGVGMCLQNMGIVMELNKSYDNAIKMEKQALEIVKKLGNRHNECQILGAIGNALMKQNKLSESEKYMKEALKISQELESIVDINTHSLMLSDLYAKRNEFKLAYTYHKLYTDYKDSIYNKENTRQFAEMKEKYESDKKQLEIEKLAKQKELDNQTIIAQTAENKKQRILIISFIAGFILILFFSIILYRLFLQKKKANQLLAKQNAEINQQKEEISAQRDEIMTQRDEIEAQRDLVTVQKDQIEEIHHELKDSINYAKRIQEALLPISDSARSVMGEHFVLFNPKDIVSGDFYFASQVNQWLIIAVADCTGHGVPGAFMSMLGISFLTEIVRKKEINQANQVLNELRKEVINALQQRGISGEQKDGMDISLLVINTETKTGQWAGANNPLYIVRKSIKSESEKSVETNFQLSDIGLYELKGDKMPIAIYPLMKDFTNHEIELKTGDCVYLFSDGFADQFGGPKGRKFMYKQFKEILFQNYDKPMTEQKKILETAIENWKGNHEQIDDITVLGIRI